MANLGVGVRPRPTGHAVVIRVSLHTECPQPPARPGIRQGPRIVRLRPKRSARMSSIPAVGVAGLSLLHLRGASFERPLECTRTS